jgi:hypothetical protein
MASTRITIVLDIEHEPDVDLPIRAARYLASTLSNVAGLGVVSLVRSETDEVVWVPLGGRIAS